MMEQPPDKILIVEDSKSIHSAIKSALEKICGTQVLVAETYAEATETIKAYGSNLLLAILDLALPDAMNGEIVDYAAAYKIPSVVFTSIFDAKTRHHILSKGVIDYVIKSNRSVEELVHIVLRLQLNREARVLVVDDSASARNMMQTFLTLYMFQVLAVESGQDALAVLAKGERIDLVLTDYEMPGMDGVELTGRLRSSFSKDELAIVGISSTDDDTLAARFLKNGANDFLRKPFGREELYCRVLNNIETLEHVRLVEAWGKKLKNSEERERQLIDNAPIGIFRSTPQGKYISTNDALAIIYGYKSSIDLTMSINDISSQLYVDPNDRVLVQNALNNRPINGMEIRRRRKDGAIIWVSLSMRAVFDATGAVSHYEGFVQDVTMRKVAEKSLKDSENIRRVIMDCVDAGIVVIDPKSHIVEIANQTAAMMFGAPIEKIVGHICHKHLCPAEMGCCPITDYGREIESAERILLRADGRKMDILKSVKRFSLGDQEKLLETFVDISQRKEAENNLERERMRLVNILEGTNAGTWEWNVQTGEAVFNERWALMAGYTLEELSPVSIKTRDQLVHPDDLKESRELLIQHFSGALQYYDCKFRMKHKDGHWIWVHDRGRVVSRSSDGNPLMMFGTHTDITASKLAHKKLEDSEERYRKFFDSADVVRLVIDPESWIIVDANKAAINFYGYDLKELLCMHIFDINTLPAQDLAAKLAESGPEMKGHFFFEHRLSSGLIRDVEVYTSLIQHRGKELLMSSVHDITELRRLEKIKHEVEHIMRHDLKAPLNGFINIPPLLIEDGNLTSDQKILLNVMGASGRKMLNQINCSLELHKIEEGRYKLIAKECCPIRLVRDNIDMLSVSKRLDSDIFLVRDRTEGAVLQTDGLLLDIVLMNLLGNALEASGPGEQVVVDIFKEGDQFVITIANSRPVPAEIRDKFFEKYVTYGKIGGTGLGTYSASIMVQALGGRITMEASEDLGTKVTVTIPDSTQ